MEDTGIGIAAEHIEHIFDRFWQADQARSYQTGGFGLGLAIAQNIAHNHGKERTWAGELLHCETTVSYHVRLNTSVIANARANASN